MDKEFDEWNEVKKKTQKENINFWIKEREIFYIKMGKNLGFEQNGKGKEFIRPIIIFKVFNKNMFLGIPLSTQLKEGKFYFLFEFKKNDKIVKNIALLSQIRLFSSKRLLNKIGVISKDDFQELKSRFIDIIK